MVCLSVQGDSNNIVYRVRHATLMRVGAFVGSYLRTLGPETGTLYTSQFSNAKPTSTGQHAGIGNGEQDTAGVLFFGRMYWTVRLGCCTNDGDI